MAMLFPSSALLSRGGPQGRGGCTNEQPAAPPRMARVVAATGPAGGQAPAAAAATAGACFGRGDDSTFSQMNAAQSEAEVHEARLREAQLEIEAEIRRRGEKVREAALIRKLESELKFGKLLIAQEKYDASLAHFDKVLALASPLSSTHGEASLARAQALEAAGRGAEARAAYESLVVFRAPFPHLRRRAALALRHLAASEKQIAHEGAAPDAWRGLDANFTADAKEGEDNSEAGSAERASWLNEYMFRVHSAGGYSPYHPEKVHAESKQERALVNVLTTSLLLLGPAIAGGLLWTNRGG